MRRRYATADVFTTEPMTGNPVAVVLDAEGLGSDQMQALAAEFNYVETTFVLPPVDPAHTAHVRIFTPDREIPFAGHPNIGTAFLLARERAAGGAPRPERFTFEEAAGLVEIELLHERGAVVGADLLSPQPLARLGATEVARAAACLGLGPEAVRTDAHPPRVVSVGLPFLVVELASRDALRRARPNLAAYAGALPLDGADAVYAYTRDTGSTDGADPGCDLQARMFAPGDGIVEDPATGSATAAAAALLAELGDRDELTLRIGQGVDMGRPSLLLARSNRRQGGTRVSVGGHCVQVMEGSFTLEGSAGLP